MSWLSSVSETLAAAPVLSVNVSTGLTNKSSTRSRVRASNAALASEFQAELELWAAEAKEEVLAAAAKAQALATAAISGTLPSVAAASLARQKTQAIDLVSERFLTLLGGGGVVNATAAKVGGAIGSLAAAADAALEAWNDASDGGLPAQVYAAKLAIAAFQVSKTECELRTKINQARALGLLPLPLAAVEAYSPRAVPLVFFPNGTGAPPPPTGARRKMKMRRSLLGAKARSRGRALLQDSASVELAELESTLATRSLPTCCSAGIEVSQQAALDAVRALLKDVPLKFTSLDVPLNESEYLSAARSYLFRCLPVVDTRVPSNNGLPNVALVSRLLPLSLWNSSLLAIYAQNGPVPNGRWQSPAASAIAPSGPMPSVNLRTVEQLYESFLQNVGRYPFFCGEKGSFATVEDACKRELAAFMANGAQESNAGYKPGDWPAYLGPVEPKSYKQGFAYSREQTMYEKCASGVDECRKYDPWPWNKNSTTSCGAGLPCGAGVNYYGRGWHQTSYAFNYFAFGISATPTDLMQFVSNPDLLGQHPANALLSAFQFAMTTAPPKPSIHEAVLGIFVPTDAAFSNTGFCPLGEKINIFVDPTTKLVVNQWMTTISVINGGVECQNGAPVSQALSRTQFYIEWLNDLGVPFSAMTPAEKATLYSIPGDPTSPPNACNICKDNPFTDQASFSPIFFRSFFFLFLSVSFFFLLLFHRV